MCGIAGIYNRQGNSRKDALKSMAALLQHRGPDGSGVYSDDTVGLAHTRLSIIDLSSHGGQPLYNEDRSLVLICNGEIYNYKDLQTGLRNKGHKFFSNSDCEVILHLYEEYNGNIEHVLSRLTGMFAFALWDIKRRKLCLARDRVGIKPLYYCAHQGILAFASEVEPVAQASIIPCGIDETSLYEYFMLGSIPGPNTLYKEVKALPPGHYISAEGGKIAVTRYWDIPDNGISTRGEDDLVDEAESLFSSIVKDHLVADVPVGTFLSAGVDSSLITAAAAMHHKGIYSYTASFPGEPEDEGVISKETADRLGTTHRSYELEGNFFKDFDYQFSTLDQPFAITSALSLGRISRLAQKEIKVVLSGDGADELFGGYQRHEPSWRPSFLAHIPARYQNTLVATAARITRRKSLAELSDNLKLSEADKFLQRTQVLEPSVALNLLSPVLKKNIDTHRYRNTLHNHFAAADSRNALDKVLYVDMKTTLVDEMLTKCDRMTMRNGIEGRVPFLDHRLVEFAFTVPQALKRNNGTGKVLLRKMLARKLGEGLAYRKKTGFNSPLRQWLQSDAQTAGYAVRQINNLAKEYFNTEAVASIANNIGGADPSAVFYLTCLGHFFKK